MQSSILLNPLPDSYKGYRVNTDFRQGLRYFRILSSELDKTDKLEAIIICFFGEDQRFKEEDIKDIWPFLDWYLSCGEKSDSEQEASEPVFDYTQDAGLVYAAFMQIYGIDLIAKTTRLHWWEFQALLTGLPSGTTLANVIDIRGKKIPNDASLEYKKEIKRLKWRYRIKTPVESEIRQKAQETKLRNMFDRW